METALTEGQSRQAMMGDFELHDVAVVVGTSSSRGRTYASVLVDEVYKRSRIEWKVFSDAETKASGLQGTTHVNLAVDTDLGMRLHNDEAYEIRVQSSQQRDSLNIDLVGASDLGLLFCVGRLLRELILGFKEDYKSRALHVTKLPARMVQRGLIVSCPAYPMRGHQIAFRPKTNSYDAFTIQQMKQQVLDLALFGCNSIEMIPPGLDDAAQSPHFPVNPLTMLMEVSTWCDELGLSVSLWYPALFSDYDDPDTSKKAKAHWSTVFGSLARLDCLFIPGGDPGGRPASDLLRVAKLQRDYLVEHFQNLNKDTLPCTLTRQCRNSSWPQVWVSSQFGLAVSCHIGMKWNPREQLEQFYHELSALAEEGRLNPESCWLSGVVYGPWTVDSIDVFRSRIPADFPMRNYPDLCHSLKAEFPQQRWDPSLAMTETREPINPRPVAMERIIKDQAPLSVGCGCYSEGVNDDVNKYIWLALHWGKDISGPLAISEDRKLLKMWLEQYAWTLVVENRDLAGKIVEGIYGLEENWCGDITSPESSVLGKTLSLFLELDHKKNPREAWSWRFQGLLFRAYYDAFIALRRKEEETAIEAFKELVQTSLKRDENVRHLIEKSLALLSVPYGSFAGALQQRSGSMVKSLRANDWKASTGSTAEMPTVMFVYGQIMHLAGNLYQGIGLQLSAYLHGGMDTERGAHLDLAWTPLSDLNFLRKSLLSLQGHREERVQKLKLLGIVQKIFIDDSELAAICEPDVVSASPILLWYGSLGDSGKYMLAGEAWRERSIDTREVLGNKELGEDPTYFKSGCVDYADTNSEKIRELLFNGSYPKSHWSWIAQIWPSASPLKLTFDTKRLLGDRAGRTQHFRLRVGVTYVGQDLLEEGADWAELGREALPTRLLANNVEVHPYIHAASTTERRIFDIPSTAVSDALEKGSFVFSFHPKSSSAVTIRALPLPVAEFWIWAVPATAARL